MTRGAARPVVVMTRSARADREFARLLAALGARPVSLPTIAVGPAPDTRPLRDALAQLPSFDWVVFTSAHAVAATCAQPAWRKAWANDRRPRVAAVGPATAARLSSRGIPVALVPPTASGRDLAEALGRARGDMAGARVLWPRSDIARRELPEALRAAGALVVEPIAYRTIPVAPRALAAFVRELEAGRIHAVAFLSPSSASGLASGLPGRSLQSLHGRTVVASIGPTTSAALRALGAPPDVEPGEHSAAALAAALMQQVAAAAGAPR